MRGVRGVRELGDVIGVVTYRWTSMVETQCSIVPLVQKYSLRESLPEAKWI